MARYYEGDLDHTRVEPQEFNEGRQNDRQGTGTLEVVLCHDIEGMVHGSAAVLPRERAIWLVAEGYAAFRAEYEQANPDWTPVTEYQHPDLEPEPDPEV